ncbi:MAG: hypothetical protein MSH28_05780 [Clostridiales bacterium]|nr:hypothetical protein [Clostridiales bacterium]MDY5607280.1 hypothetical protein [Lentihominibacter sp.]
MKLRRTIIVACCVIIATMGIALTGCGGSDDKYADSPYVGTWAAKTAEYSGVEVDVAEIIGAFEITLNADGSASMLEEGETLECDWEPTDSGVTMKDSTQVDLTYEDGKLVTEMSGVTFYFEKKE